MSGCTLHVPIDRPSIRQPNEFLKQSNVGSTQICLNKRTFL